MNKKSEKKSISFAPTKHFFVTTLTNDVDLEDSILDLIDNSIDSYITYNYKGKREIYITFNKKIFNIKDNCGGIIKKKIYSEVFRLGAKRTDKKGTIGIYGIGLKRAMFKIGQDILLESDDGKEYFSVYIPKKWLDDDFNWDIGFKEERKSKGEKGFTLTIKDLYPEVGEQFESIPFQELLIEKIQRFHSIHIQKRVNVYVNGILIKPYTFKLLDDGKKFIPLREKLTVNEVEIEIIAGFTREEKLHGWCIFCNDRMVLMNDESHRTGFGKMNYHPFQDSEFLGMVFLNAKDPSKLPWKSQKDDLSLENSTYRSLIPRMQEITADLIGGLSRKLYNSVDDMGTTIGKSIFESVKVKEWSMINYSNKCVYPKLRTRKAKETVTKYTSIQYSVLKDTLKKVKKHMGRPSMSNKDVGEKTFNYYVEIEEIE